MTDHEIVVLISKRRRQCLVHRFLYYVRSATLISDQQYDIWERELRQWVEDEPLLAAEAAYDEDCPTRVPGSSLLDTYPREIQYLADSLLAYAPHYVPGRKWEPHVEIVSYQEQGLFG